MNQQEEPSPEPGSVTLSGVRPTVITLIGEFDAANVEEVRAVLGSVEAGDVTLDLAEVTFCSSAVLACLLHLQRCVAERGGGLVVVGISPVMEHLLVITGTRDLFPTASH